jgi:organic hydroperoxide reductase OsmC/OhrA
VSEMTKHHARITWQGDKDDLRAHEIELAGQKLAGSCSAHWGGDPGKADPEELFVASLAACHMLWFLDFARRGRHRVISYEDEPEGTLDGSRFTEVVLRPRVVFENDVSEDATRRLHDQAHEACFIANSVNCTVRVEPRLP